MLVRHSGQSSPSSIIIFTTNAAVVVEVAVILTEGPRVRMLISIKVLLLIPFPGEEYHPHLGLHRQVVCELEVFSGQEPRPYPDGDRWGSPGDVRVVWRQPRRVRSLSAHSRTVEPRRHAKLCGNSALHI